MRVVQSEIIDLIREHWLSNVAHNLSNPIFAARGYIRMVLRAADSELSEGDRHYLTLALDNIDKLFSQVRALEAFPAIRDFEFTSFCVRDLLREILEQMAPSLADKNTRLNQFFPAGSANTIGDRTKVRLALEEFLAAAARFAIPDGALDVSVRQTNGLIAVVLNADSASRPPEAAPDIAGAAGLWQLHGGYVRTCRTDKGYSLTCELPVIHFSEKQAMFVAEG